MNVKSALALAQLSSLVVFGLAAAWYLVPWLRTQSRARALTVLLWPHVFRYVALQVFAAQQAGFPISDSARDGILIGDLAGAVLALLAIAALRAGARWSTALAWALFVQTTYDTVANVRAGIHEHLFGLAQGVSWLVVAFYVPVIVVSLALIAWQLWSRRAESLASEDRQADELGLRYLTRLS
ncbi:MAG: hypothetical protein ACM3SU_01355 [Acidobacteriota bacterium]